MKSNKDLLLMVEKSGVIVLEKTFSTRKTDAHSSWVEDTAYIVLGTTRKTFVRRIFDIAHELGHIVLHRKVNITSQSKDEFRKIEKEANEFASALLLPKQEFVEDLELIQTSISNLKSYLAMKEKYFVSIAAMGYRAFNLGKMSVNQRNYFFASINKYGYKEKEPYDDMWKIKKPSFILSFIDFLDSNDIWKFQNILKEHFYQQKFISNLLSIDESLFIKYLNFEDNNKYKFSLLK